MNKHEILSDYNKNCKYQKILNLITNKKILADDLVTEYYFGKTQLSNKLTEKLDNSKEMSKKMKKLNERYIKEQNSVITDLKKRITVLEK